MFTRRQVVAGLACLGPAQFGTAACSEAGVARDSALPDTRGWPSLMDTLPPAIRKAVEQGQYAGDLTGAIEAALATGDDFVIPGGIYPFAGGRLECRTPGQRIIGTGGVLRRLPQRDGIGLLVSAKGVALHGMRCDGAAPGAPTHHNDMLKVTGDDCLINRLEVRGSWGSNLRLDGTRGTRVLHPMLTDAHQNNILVCNAPTRDILIESPICQRTRTQNNIFVTASEGSSDNGEIISGVVINNAQCSDAGDTAIELGYHCRDCSVTGGRAVNSYNPPLLQRDGYRNRWQGITVLNRRLADQHPNYDGVAVIPQWETASWDSESVFQDIVVQGAVRRSAFYWGQSGIHRIDCIAQAYAPGEQPAAPGKRIGSGDLKAGGVSNIAVQGGSIDGFGVGDNWNFDGAAYARRDCVTRGVTVTRCDRVLGCFNITPARSAFVDNRCTENARTDILLVNAVLVPTDARPDTGLIYDGNIFSPPAAIDPGAAMLLTRNSRFVRIPPAGQSGTGRLAPLPGRYRVTSAEAQSEFEVVAPPGGAILRNGSGPINAAIEKDRLVLHQRGQTPRPIWVKISGPGISAAFAA